MEMDESPEVAIIQHASGVLKVTETWFEACSKYFSLILHSLIIRMSMMLMILTTEQLHILPT
jgi:hypothetical protein